MAYLCPVCDHKGLDEAPYNKYGLGSDEICPCCGFHFGAEGVPDRESAHSSWRRDWVNKGCPWFSKFRRAPADWKTVILTLDLETENTEA